MYKTHWSVNTFLISYDQSLTSLVHKVKLSEESSCSDKSKAPLELVKQFFFQKLQLQFCLLSYPFKFITTATADNICYSDNTSVKHRNV